MTVTAAAPQDASSDTTQTDGEGPDGSDKPPQSGIVKSSDRQAVPLPPPEAFAHPKEPSFASRGLDKLVFPQSPNHQAPPPGSISKQQSGGSSSKTPSVTSSPTISDSEGAWSVPSTRPPSQAPSRHPSVSKGVSGSVNVQPATPTGVASPKAPSISGSKSTAGEVITRPPSGRAPSVTSDAGHKFTLKDLLGSGPKLSRKSSARSNASSKKSDSEGGGGGPKSVGGESTMSLSQKYGVCQKVAIGKGATSVVRLAHKWDRTQEKLYAIKEFRKRRKNETEKEYVKKLTAEFCISSTLHHINVVETVDLVQDESAHWCEVMEFCPGGDLYAAIKKGGMSPSEVECCFKQILTGVEYLHSQGVAHRDIKPENLFFDGKGHLKIGDYGASTVYRLPWEATVHMSSGLCGSEPYIAPEQFLGKPYDARLVDIWACGIVYYCLHFQELPWRAAQQSDTLYTAYASACIANPVQSSIPAKSKSTTSSMKPSTSSTPASPNPSSGVQQYPPTITNLSPRSCRPILRRMLEPDPKKRAPIEEIVKNSWVESIEVCHAVPEPKHVHVCAQAMASQLGLA
jgi:protein-serine/threonine kinase